MFYKPYWKKFLRGIILSLIFLVLVFNLVRAEAGKATNNVNVFINGQKVSFDVPPRIENGRVLVPFRSVFEPLGGIVRWKAEQKMVIARYGLLDLRLRVGDHMGRMGNKNIELDVPARIVHGRTLVPLRFISESLFSANVHWDSTTKKVNISSGEEKDLEPLIGEFQTTILGKRMGEVIDVSNLEIMGVPEIIPERVPHPESPFTLLFSDSPEYVDQPGVTYRGKGKGNVRLVYYHIPRLSSPARIALVAHNPGNENALIQVDRQVNGDKKTNRKFWQDLGSAVTLDYLNQEAASDSPTYNVPAGSSVLLNPDTVDYQPGELMYGITDLFTDKELQFSFIIIQKDDMSDVLSKTQNPVLPADGRHDRGTFSGGDQLIEVNFENKIAGFLIGDGFSDPALLGKDEATGQDVQLLGNYGVNYYIRAKFAHPASVILVPLGGDIFSGGLVGPEGLLSFLKVPTFSKALSLGEFNEGDRVEWRFMPPSGSSLPVLIIVVPQ